MQVLQPNFAKERRNLTNQEELLRTREIEVQSLVQTFLELHVRLPDLSLRKDVTNANRKVSVGRPSVDTTRTDILLLVRKQGTPVTLNTLSKWGYSKHIIRTLFGGVGKLNQEALGIDEAGLSKTGGVGKLNQDALGMEAGPTQSFCDLSPDHTITSEGSEIDDNEEIIDDTKSSSSSKTTRSLPDRDDLEEFFN